MIIHDYHNKKYIEIKDNKVIFYRFLYKRTLDLNKIRAAYIDDNYNLRILYGKVIKFYKICNVKNSEKELLNSLVESLNNDKIIFSYDGIYRKPYSFCFIFIAVTLLMIFQTTTGSRNIIVYMYIGILLITDFLTPYSHSIFIYDYKNDLIKLEGNYGKSKKYYVGVDKPNIIYKPIDKIYKLEVSKLDTLIIRSNVIYPLNYKENLSNIYKASNDINYMGK